MDAAHNIAKDDNMCTDHKANPNDNSSLYWLSVSCTSMVSLYRHTVEIQPILHLTCLCRTLCALSLDARHTVNMKNDGFLLKHSYNTAT